jgi:hypothetical protein
MEKQKNDENEKQSFAPILFTIGLLIVATPFIFAYGAWWIAEYNARVLIPPLYSKSIEIVSGESEIQGNCCLSKTWEYCVDASLVELRAHFEAYLGELNTATTGTVYYEKSSPPLIGETRFNPYMWLEISEAHSECEGMSWYSIYIRYEAPF